MLLRYSILAYKASGPDRHNNVTDICVLNAGDGKKPHDLETHNDGTDNEFDER